MTGRILEIVINMCGAIYVMKKGGQSNRPLKRASLKIAKKNIASANRKVISTESTSW
ncbi:MAG: hypothetical protein U5K69_05320 [Balneolaceae bacterium]|nr:hypothetical protein [Balneolaceae bacterium]